MGLPVFPCDALPSSCLPMHSSVSTNGIVTWDVEPPVEAPVEPPVEAPVELPVEAPVETTIELSVEATVEPSVETTVEPSVEATGSIDDDSHIIVGSVTPAYEQFTVKELRDMCRAKELQFDGKKAELLQRLCALR